MNDDSAFRLLISIIISGVQAWRLGARHFTPTPIHLSSQSIAPRRLARLRASALHMLSAGGRFGSPSVHNGVGLSHGLGVIGNHWGRKGANVSSLSQSLFSGHWFLHCCFASVLLTYRGVWLRICSRRV
jgi:hypothetical protein